MITLTTGTPGAGKTLSTLYYVEQQRQKEGREVFYSGIKDLRLPWIELEDPAKWFEVPSGAIVVIDECQRLFRPRSTGSQVPEYVSRLETHRHAGVDLYLITQHPMLVDTNVRRLVGCHRHVVRSWGMQRATLHEWGSVKVDCDRNRSDSVRHELSYPKEVFDWYQSAEVHTVKRRIPARVWMLLCLPVLLVALGWVLWQSMARYGDSDKEAGPSLAETVEAARVPGQSVAARPVSVAAPSHKPASQWFSERVPRVPELAYTAPVYDEITRPVQAPYPAACIASASRCVCYSQQATILPQVSDGTCRQIVARGMYLDWQPGAGVRAAPRDPVSVGPGAPAGPVSPAGVPSPGQTTRGI